MFKYDFFFPFKVKTEFAFTRLCRVLFYKMALFEVTELLCVRVFVDMLSRFETYRRTRHRTWIQVGPVHVELEGRTTWVTRDFTAASSRVKLCVLTGSHSDAALLSNVLAPSFTGGKVQLW